VPCHTCRHTLSNLGLDEAGRRVFWCPRCGSLKTDLKTESAAPHGGDNYTESESPKLVERVRDLLGMLNHLRSLPRDVTTQMVAVREAVNGSQS
jgi:hypothetical protein